MAHPKKIIGSPAGLPVIVSPVNDLLGLAICEGIEDALSVYAATGLGAWAAGGAGALARSLSNKGVAVSVTGDADGR